MGLTALAIIFLCVGDGLLQRGFRGRAIDDHPICAHCRFDLSGRPQPGGNCPECGAKLWRSNAVRVGNREKREGLIYAGAAVLLLLALPCIALTLISFQKINLIRLKPVWWLVRDAANWDTRYWPDPYTAELLYRVKHAALSAEDDKRIIELALAARSV